MKNPTYYIMLFLVVGLLSCEAPAPENTIDMDEVRSEIQALEDAYEKAANANDAEAVVEYFSDDAHRLPPNGPMIKGKEAILANMKEGEDDGSTLKLEVVEVFADGDLAVEVGKWTSVDSSGMEATGKYISVFEKRDGKYLCIRDIWNADKKDDQESDDEAENGSEEMEDGEE